MELDEQKLQKQKQQQQQQQQPAGVLKKKDSFREKEKLYLDSDDSSDDGLRTRISRPRKQISWRYSRTPSPMPAQKSRDASPVPAASRKSRTPSPATPALQKVPSQSRIIAQNLLLQATNAAADAPPPLPYNIKSKKRNARRIQSIHHMVEPPSSMQSSSDQERSDRSEPEQASEKSVSVEAGNTTEDSGSWERPPVVEPSVQPEAAHAPLNLTSPSKKTLLVPCRLTDSSMVDLTMLPKPFTAKDQIRLAMLLSTQESKYGFNMFDSLVPGDNEEIARLMSMGIRYEDAVLIVFEKRYVTKPHEQLRSSPIPLNEYKPHVLASIPSTAAQTLGAELGRSMSPKPRPQSLPVTLARHENPDLESYSGDYGLNQHEYPGYTTVHHSNSAGPASANVSRTHSPFPYMQPSSAGASRTHSPHPADLYVNRQVPSVGASRTQSPMPTTGSFMANSPMPGAMNSRTHSPHPQNNNNYARPMPIPPPIVIPHSPQAQPAVAYYQQPVQAQAQFLDPMPPRSHGGSAVSSRNASRAHTPMNSPGTNLNNNHNNNTPTNQNTVYYDNPLKGTPPSPHHHHHHHHHPVVAPVPHNPGRGAPYSAPLPAGSIEPSVRIISFFFFISVILIFTSSFLVVSWWKQQQ